MFIPEGPLNMRDFERIDVESTMQGEEANTEKRNTRTLLPPEASTVARADLPLVVKGPGGYYYLL